MDREGPELERLLQRLANTPADFLSEPKKGRKGWVDVTAVAADLCRDLGMEPTAQGLSQLARGATRNSLATSLLLCWLFADDWFRHNGADAQLVLTALGEGARDLAQQTASKKFVEDVERREELARFSLARLGLRPRGESKAQAEDRLTSLSAAERSRVLKAAREAEARSRAVREALARKAAEESADKWSRE